MINKKLRERALYQRLNKHVKRIIPPQHRAEGRRLAERILFPERPAQLWGKARKLIKQPPISKPEGRHLGPATALNAVYIRWLRNQSMLHRAEKQAASYSGRPSMWKHPYAAPRPHSAIAQSSVWYTAYPASLITKDKQSILTTLGDEKLWQAFQDIGITGLHTGPMKYAGGVDGWKFTPSIDGYFDRISNRIDQLFGTEDEYQKMTATAQKHGGIIIDDLIPGHTGKGFDFRLAEMNYETYPGIYHMVEIPPQDWPLLPDVSKGQDAVNLDPACEAELKRRGYIIGELPRVMFYEPGIKDTNWSATKPVKGVDGVRRRWVYLHFYKQGQPTINWLDPSFSGMKLVIGDALHSIDQLGCQGLRLDANAFLGIERTSDDTPAWSEGHPLSEAANHVIAGSVRKVGGFTFQEFNVQLDDMQAMGSGGADLSYDFISRPAYHHAFVTGNVDFLRLMLQEARKYHIKPMSLVHALQNHDELTYELVHFTSLHKDEPFTYAGERLTGSELRTRIQQELRDGIIGDSDKPYNLPYTENGIACTTASIITAVLGVKQFSDITEVIAAKACDAHLLLAMFNALQPGVFAVSGWDLRGTLTLDPLIISHLLESGDTRWMNRGAYDIMDVSPHATESLSSMPKAICLYPSLPEQLADPRSFAYRLKHILAIRQEQHLDAAIQLDIPDCSNPGVLALVHRLPHNSHIQLTLLNFTNQTIPACTITSDHLPASTPAIDRLSATEVGSTTKLQQLRVTLNPYQGMSIEFSSHVL